MAEYLNNIVNKLPQTPQINPGDTLNKLPIGPNLNIPQVPKIENPLKALEGKIPSKELAEKAAAKYKELQDKFNNLKLPKNTIKKPKPLKLKEIPIPKKFKKAELEKFKGLANFQNIKEKTQGLTSQAQSAVSKAKGLTSKAEGLSSKIKGVVDTAKGGLEKGQNLTSQVKNFKPNIG